MKKKVKGKGGGDITSPLGEKSRAGWNPRAQAEQNPTWEKAGWGKRLDGNKEKRSEERGLEGSGHGCN